MNTDHLRQKHADGFADLTALWTKIEGLETALGECSDIGFEFVEDRIERSVERIRAFEPSVSVIGQVKAGKSTLLNALIGQTDLLPSDVNPWTSVITNIHLNARNAPFGTKAMFRFFDADEWDRLVETGGRLGEMATRAGFDTEADQVRAQVTQMRQTTEERLGEDFEKLLDGTHTFPTLDKSVIDRYICYGDPEELEEGSEEGVYADITKSADLYVDIPGFPTGLCLRDTPGVNDTFMMREQITLNAISESRVCVVVLSAHQALSNMDLALLRMISSIEAREVVIFVNRIDELEDPKGESVKIRKSIEKTLKRIGISDQFQILFGSGYWANVALSDSCGTMMPVSRAALESFYDGKGVDLTDPETLREKAMEASGVTRLHKAISKRVVEGPGKAMLADLQAEIDAIMRMTDTVVALSERSGSAGGDVSEMQRAVEFRVDELREKVRADFEVKADEIRDFLRRRLTDAQQTFVNAAIVSLQSHIDTFGETDQWTHEPTALRLMMKSAYKLSCAKLRRLGEGSVEDVLDGVEAILQQDLDVFQDSSTVEFPTQPLHKAPTAIAKTLSLDLGGSWWRKFWKLGSKNAAEKRYRAVIEAETQPIIEELIDDAFQPAVERTREVVEDFVEDHAKFLDALLKCTTDQARRAA